jgi:hypothetical protein
MGQDTEKNKQQSNQGDPGNQQDTSWKQQPGNPKKDPQQGGGDYGNQRDQQDQNKKRRAS